MKTMDRLLHPLKIAVVVLTFALGVMANPALAADKSPSKKPAKPTVATVDVQVQTVNINSADAETLAAVLTGVGKVKAQAIIEYRQQVGGFKAVEELEAVKGIGPATLAKNRDRIKLK